MQINKSILENQLRLLTIPLAGTETVTVLVLVGTGSKHELEEQAGISHFLEHLMFKGTKKRPSTKIISEELDSVGGMFNAFTGNEATGYWVKSEKAHLNLALDVISDMLSSSKLENLEIDRERGVILEEIKMYQDIPQEYVGELFEKLLYENQPAGRPVIGYPKNIKSFTRKNFVDYLASQYKSSNIIIAIAGNFASADLNINKFFGSFKPGIIKDKPGVTENQDRPQEMVFLKKTDQTHLCLGFRAKNARHKDRYALMVLANVLGGMMSSRIWLSVRERQGLAYYVKTHYEKNSDTGYIVTQAGVAHNKIKPALNAILKEYANAHKISLPELTKAKENLKGKLLINLEASEEVANFAAGQELLRQKILTPSQIIAKINKISSSDIERVAQETFQNKNLNLCLITPKKSSYLSPLSLK